MENSRLKAAEMGQKTYFGDKPCRNNHTSERYTTTGNCIQCIKDKNAAIRQQLKDGESNRNALIQQTKTMKALLNHRVPETFLRSINPNRHYVLHRAADILVNGNAATIELLVTVVNSLFIENNVKADYPALSEVTR